MATVSPKRPGSMKRTGVAASLAAFALITGAGLLPGAIGIASASGPGAGHLFAPSAPAKSAPTSSPTPATTPAPAASTPAPAPTASTLSPGPAPTSVPASVTRRLLGVVQSTNDGSVTVTVTTAGRYTLEYDTSLPGAFNNVIDGVHLQQTGVGYQTTGYSQTFQLSAGKHVIALGGPEVDGPANEYLVGPLAS